MIVKVKKREGINSRKDNTYDCVKYLHITNDKFVSPLRQLN